MVTRPDTFGIKFPSFCYWLFNVRHMSIHSLGLVVFFKGFRGFLPAVRDKQQKMSSEKQLELILFNFSQTQSLSC